MSPCSRCDRTRGATTWPRRSSTRSPRACPNRARASSPGDVLASCKFGDRLGPDQLQRVPGTPVQQQRREARQVEGVGEQPGVSRHAAQARRALVVHLPDEQAMPENGVVLGRRDAVPPLGRGQEPGRGHPQGSEHAPREKAVERLPGEPLDHLHQHDGTQVRVAIRRSRRGEQRGRVHGLERRGACPSRIVQRQIRDQAGGMGEQVADGDLVFHRPRELRQVPLYRRVERELPLVYEQHARAGEADHLRERGQVVDRARLHGPAIAHGVHPHGREHRQAAVSTDRQHRAGKRAAVGLGSEIADHARQARAVEPEGPG